MPLFRLLHAPETVAGPGGRRGWHVTRSFLSPLPFSTSDGSAGPRLPHPTTKQSHVKFTRDFVDSCHPLCLVPPTLTGLTPRFKRERVGFFFWSSVPPLRTLLTATPSLAPKRELEGVSLPPPTPPSAAPRINAPGLRTASTPPACAPHQCPRPACRVNAPGLRAVSMPPACAPCRRPQPARCINPSPPSPALCPCLRIDTPTWCAVSMPSPVQEEGLLSPPLL